MNINVNRPESNKASERTQTILFGYRKRCHFERARYRPNIVMTGDPKRHSEKPDETYRLIEDVSSEPRLELFARRRRPGWHVWGNEVSCDVELVTQNAKLTDRRDEL